MSTRRKGRIAQLPYEMRTRVNEMLRDGRPYKVVAAECIRAGFPDVNEKNVEYWAKPDPDTGTCGHQDWLREQERLNDIRARREFAMEVVKANPGSDMHEASVQLMASQLYEIASDFQVQSLKERLAEKPELYGQIVGMCAQLSKSGLEFAKLRQRVEEFRKKFAEESKRATVEGITPETLTRIEQELRLL